MTCQLPTNPDGTPSLPAGMLTPEVFLKGFGFVKISGGGGVQPIQVPFEASSL